MMISKNKNTEVIQKRYKRQHNNIIYKDTINQIYLKTEDSSSWGATQEDLDGTANRYTHSAGLELTE